MSTTIDVRTSGIWQTTSTILAADGACLVVDPAYFPRELEELSALAARRGQVLAVVFTHGHWDHVIGWQSFPGTAVWTSPSLADAIASRSAHAAKNLADASEFDARWYVERPAPLDWPAAAVGLREGQRIVQGGIAVESILLPGHSADGLALIVGERVLLPGDYLSPCEIPFVEDVHAYRATLRRLLELLPQIEEVIPGHGPRLPWARAQAIAAEDLGYLDKLALAGDRGDRDAALGITLPRAADVPGMREHHLENCRAAGIEIAAPTG
jgi:glyoxylase-like metal-dependent hydrolase (beta-lactamase superfamily II)